MKVKEKITEAIGTIGYDIIDNFIAPKAGISQVMADLYLVSFGDYLDDKEEREVMVEVLKKYGLGDDEFLPDYMENMPIALIALYIMESGNYFK